MLWDSNTVAVTRRLDFPKEATPPAAGLLWGQRDGGGWLPRVQEHRPLLELEPRLPVVAVSGCHALSWGLREAQWRPLKGLGSTSQAAGARALGHEAHLGRRQRAAGPTNKFYQIIL